MSTIPDIEIQNKIIDFVVKNPGTHISKISEALELQLFIIEYHLKYLHKKGFIHIIQKEGINHYYYEDKNLKMRDFRAQGIRQKICTLIVEKPGLSLSAIADNIGMSMQLADYHLTYLLRNNEIMAVQDTRGTLRRYYAKDTKIGSYEKHILEKMRKKIPLKIILLLIRNGTLKHKELYEKLGISPSKLSYHLNILLEDGILVVQTHGSEKGYELRDEQDIINVVKKYRLKLEAGIAIEDFVGTWEDFNYDT